MQRVASCGFGRLVGGACCGASCALSIFGLGEAESGQLWLWERCTWASFDVSCGLWWMEELCIGASFGASCGARCGASCGVSCGLSIFGLWEAKSGQLGLWELEVWPEYFLPGGLRGASGGQRLGRV